MNCTSIDWFLQWPETALAKVAMSFLGKQDQVFALKTPRMVKLPKSPSALLDQSQEVQDQSFDIYEEPLSQDDCLHNRGQLDLRARVTQVFVRMHLAVVAVAEDYQRELGRQVYITPTRFTQQFGYFEHIIIRKTKQIEDERGTYLMGI